MGQNSQQANVSSHEDANELHGIRETELSSIAQDANLELPNTAVSQEENSLANAVEATTGVDEVVKEIEENKRDTPAQDVRGGKLQSGSTFLDMLKHDRDGKASAKVLSKFRKLGLSFKASF